MRTMSLRANGLRRMDSPIILAATMLRAASIVPRHRRLATTMLPSRATTGLRRRRMDLRTAVGLLLATRLRTRLRDRLTTGPIRVRRRIGLRLRRTIAGPAKAIRTHRAGLLQLRIRNRRRTRLLLRTASMEAGSMEAVVAEANTTSNPSSAYIHAGALQLAVTIA
jgi:hypothetical protein